MNEPLRARLAITPKGDGEVELSLSAQGAERRLTGCLPGREPLELYNASRKRAVTGHPSAEDAVRNMIVAFDSMLAGSDGFLPCGNPEIMNDIVLIEVNLSEPLHSEYPWELIAGTEFARGPRSVATVWRGEGGDARPTPSSSTLLVVGSSPLDLGYIHPHLEARTIQELGAVHPIAHIEAHPDASYDEFRTLLQVTRPRVLHLIGHGQPESITFRAKSDPYAVPRDVPLSEIARVIERTPTVSCVVFSSCDVGRRSDHTARTVGERLAQAGISVIAFTGKLPSRVAVRFSEAFYSSVLAGDPIDISFSRAIVAMRHHADSLAHWSMWTMHSPNPNIIPFPSHSQQRLRIGIEEICDQFAQLGSDALAIESNRSSAPALLRARATRLRLFIADLRLLILKGHTFSWRGEALSMQEGALEDLDRIRRLTDSLEMADEFAAESRVQNLRALAERNESSFERLAATLAP